jgi:hypothetical protein
MSDSSWYVLDGEGTEQGPYSAADLQGYYTSGNINHETMIWTEGLEQWVPAGQVEGLLPVVPQIVELAPAPLAAVAPVQAAPVAGMNLSPQIPGLATPRSAKIKKTPAPTWISSITLLIGAAALILFFFPWVSIQVNATGMGGKSDTTAFHQTGMQSITQRITPNRDFLKLPLKMLGLSDEEVTKAVDEMVTSSANGKDDFPYDKATLVMVAIILVGLGLVACLIGFVNCSRSFIIGAQLFYIVGAIMISIQMAKQFPAPSSFISEQRKEMKISVDEAEKTKKGSGKAIETQFNNVFQTKFETSCFATVGILGASLLLIVITMSSGGSPPITIPQPGTATPQPGAMRFQ